MKLHLTQAAGNQLITGYSQSSISVNHRRFEQSIIVMPNEIITDWNIDEFDELTPQSFDRLLTIKPEVLLLGTGTKHRFIHPKIIASLTQAHIPVECMTTDAACRTYNILMAEGRQVAAALIL